MKNTIMKKVLFTMILLALALPTMAKDVTVAFVPGIADPFYFTMERGIKEKAKELGGIEVVVAEYPKSWGPEFQVPILNAAVAKGNIDILLIAPTSTEALIQPLKRIYDRGIEIITVDTFLGDGDYSKKGTSYDFPLSYIGSDNEKGGFEIGENLAKLLDSKGQVYIQTTNPDVSSVVGRVNGFTKATANMSGIQLVGVDYNQDDRQRSQA